MSLINLRTQTLPVRAEANLSRPDYDTSVKKAIRYSGRGSIRRLLRTALSLGGMTAIHPNRDP